MVYIYFFIYIALFEKSGFLIDGEYSAKEKFLQNLESFESNCNVDSPSQHTLQFQVAVRLWLGITLFPVHPCAVRRKCCQLIDSFDDHLLGWRHIIYG